MQYDVEHFLKEELDIVKTNIMNKIESVCDVSCPKLLLLVAQLQKKRPDPYNDRSILLTHWLQDVRKSGIHSSSLEILVNNMVSGNDVLCAQIRKRYPHRGIFQFRIACDFNQKFSEHETMKKLAADAVANVANSFYVFFENRDVLRDTFVRSRSHRFLLNGICSSLVALFGKFSKDAACTALIRDMIQYNIAIYKSEFYNKAAVGHSN